MGNPSEADRQSPAAGSHYHQIALSLAGESAWANGSIRLRVDGDSMCPLMHTGDFVLAKPSQPEDLRRGDLVVVQRGTGTVTHRLVAGNPREGWRTKGDSYPQLDPPIPQNAILGRVVAIERGGKPIELQGRTWSLVNRWLGLLGWWEARLMGAGKGLKQHMLAGWPRSWTALAVHLAAFPFRVLARLLLYFAR